MAYTPSHSRSKSYGASPLPPPPTDQSLGPTSYTQPSHIYRRHSRKKSSQILVEPFGAPTINHMPMSPTIAVPQGLEPILQTGPPPMLHSKRSIGNMNSPLSPSSQSSISSSPPSSTLHTPSSLAPESHSGYSSPNYSSTQINGSGSPNNIDSVDTSMLRRHPSMNGSTSNNANIPSHLSGEQRQASGINRGSNYISPQPQKHNPYLNNYPTVSPATSPPGSQFGFPLQPSSAQSNVPPSPDYNSQPVTPGIYSPVYPNFATQSNSEAAPPSKYSPLQTKPLQSNIGPPPVSRKTGHSRTVSLIDFDKPNKYRPIPSKLPPPPTTASVPPSIPITQQHRGHRKNFSTNYINQENHEVSNLPPPPPGLPFANQLHIDANLSNSKKPNFPIININDKPTNSINNIDNLSNHNTTAERKSYNNSSFGSPPHSPAIESTSAGLIPKHSRSRSSSHGASTLANLNKKTSTSKMNSNTPLTQSNGEILSPLPISGSRMTSGANSLISSPGPHPAGSPLPTGTPLSQSRVSSISSTRSVGSENNTPSILDKNNAGDSGSSDDGNSAFSANVLASGASFLIAAQFFSKLITFSLNQLILRFVGPEVFGTNAQLELIINTVLFFSREAIRLATQRQTLAGKKPDVYRFEGGLVQNTVSGTVQEVINIGFIPILFGIPLSCVLSAIYLRYNTNIGYEDPRSVKMATIIFAICSVIELAGEPSFLLFQLKLQFRKRAAFESIAITCRCMLTFLISLLDAHHSNTSIVAFAVGQLAYSTVLTGLYIYNGIKEARMGQYELLKPQPVWTEVTSSTTKEEKTYFNNNTKTLAASIWLQTIFKHCLTEGDKFLISLLLPITDQGVYAVVMNYGSLIARLLFLPIEEALRNFFSKLLSGATPTNSNVELSISVISTLLRFYSYLSIFAVTFGPVISGYVLQFLISEVWLDTDAPIVLATYACYLPFLAINGALEALVQSVATSSDIKHQSSVMLIFSVSFTIAAYVLMRPLGLGAQGLVLANMFNMAQRIGWCLMWIEHYYSKLLSSSSISGDIDDLLIQEKLHASSDDEKTDKNEETKKTKSEKSEYKSIDSKNIEDKDTNSIKLDSSDDEDHAREGADNAAIVTGSNKKVDTEASARHRTSSKSKSISRDRSDSDSSQKSDILSSTIIEENEEDEEDEETEVKEDINTKSKNIKKPIAEIAPSSTKSKFSFSAKLNSLKKNFGFTKNESYGVSIQDRVTMHKKWGWLRLSAPNTLVSIIVVSVVMPISWTVIGRVDNLRTFTHQILLALLLLIVIGFAEKELFISASNQLLAVIKDRRARRKLAQLDKDK